MYYLFIIAGLWAFASSVPCVLKVDNVESNRKLLLSLNKNLLQSLAELNGLSNPSVHLALRLSDYHNLAMESDHLNKLRNAFHNDIQSSLSNSQPVVGRMALYTLALKSSCYDLNNVTFTVSGKSERLLTQLKSQMEQEKEHIALSQRPLTNYYQYSLGVLALCVSGIRVNNHVSHKLIKAVEHNHFNLGDDDDVDTNAMAAMALQCVKDTGDHMHNPAELDSALSKIKSTILASKRADNHFGNEFSTGLAVQALFAMGSQVSVSAAPIAAIRSSARSNTYHNPMAISQALPALVQKSYLTVKNKECLNEDDTLVLEPTEPVVVLPSNTKVTVTVKVVASSGTITIYSLDVSKGGSLLDALDLLMAKNVGFTFGTESSLWGPFLSVVNSEQARQSDRRYWSLSSDGIGLTEGISDYKIEATQEITITNTSY